MASNIVQLREDPDPWHQVARHARTIEQLAAEALRLRDEYPEATQPEVASQHQVAMALAHLTQATALLTDVLRHDIERAEATGRQPDG